MPALRSEWLKRFDSEPRYRDDEAVDDALRRLFGASDAMDFDLSDSWSRLHFVGVVDAVELDSILTDPAVAALGDLVYFWPPWAPAIGLIERPPSTPKTWWHGLVDEAGVWAFLSIHLNSCLLLERDVRDNMSIPIPVEIDSGGASEECVAAWTGPVQ